MKLFDAYLIFINEKTTYDSPETVDYYTLNLLRFFGFVSPEYKNMECEDLKLDHVKSYIQYLRTTGIKNVSVNTYTRASEQIP